MRRVRESLLLWKSNKYYVFVRVCARACGCSARGRVHARVVLLIQRASRMGHIVTSFVASLALPRSSTLSHKRRDFQKNLLNIKYIFFSTILI